VVATPAAFFDLSEDEPPDEEPPPVEPVGLADWLDAVAPPFEDPEWCLPVMVGIEGWYSISLESSA
jgi:hypothetical protein